MKRLLFTILAVVLTLGLVASCQLYRDSAPTPDGVVKRYISRITENTPHKVESIEVVSSNTYQDGHQGGLLLFRATEAETGIHMTGYAILQPTVYGWHVQKLQMTGKSPLPQDILAELDWSEGKPVLFGEVLLADASSIEAVFDDPNAGRVVIQEETLVGNFMLPGPRYGQLLEVRLLDSKGNTLRRLTARELSGDP